MPENLLGGQGATLLTAIIVVAIALLALVGVFWLIRNRAASTFIRGGKNRQPRLAVLDATAVDTRRRLVLIRRDDVEHLVMIGGPTDIVIESGIAQNRQARARQATDEAVSTPAREPRAARPGPGPAPRPAAPQHPRSTAAQPAPATATPVERPARQTEALGHQPPPPVRQPSQDTTTAATVASLGPATASRTEAADLLESARNRVFEEPGLEESDREDLLEVPQTPVQRPEPAQPAASTASTRAPAPSGKADPIQAEAADVLETVRTRIFEEPTFDEDAFDELTARPAAKEQTASANAAASASRATFDAPPAVPAASQPDQAAATSDFEAVLAAELSEDPMLGTPGNNFIAAQYNEHQLDPEEAERLEAPDVKPEPQPSRDSLEAEMEKLLGDLSVKP